MGGVLVKRRFCPECQMQGELSTVMVGSGTRTLLASYPYWDEEGRYHFHDYNTSRYHYSCSRGHQWAETETGSCWCGWKAVT